MYLTLSIVLLFLFCTITIIIPLRFPGLLLRVTQVVRKKVGGESPEVTFSPPVPEEQRVGKLVRAWGGLSTVLFACTGLLDEGFMTGESSAIAVAVGYGVLSMFTSALCVLSFHALHSFIPNARVSETLSHCGLRGLWMMDSGKSQRSLQEALSSRLRASKKLCVIDVCGYELLGKGAGPTGGLLVDVLDQEREVPVYILLCKPDAKSLDPERRKTSVLQNLLAEMNVSHSIYLRRLSMTTEVVEILNEDRQKQAKIKIRFYKEKPAFRALLVDDSCVAIPWHPREESVDLPYVDIARESGSCSFYESYRRHFARLWGDPIELRETTPLRKNSLPERALSGSFAVRPAGWKAKKEAIKAL